jgi:hypothetical protein
MSENDERRPARVIRDGDTYRKGEDVDRVRVPPDPEPDGPLQRLLGGPGETWGTDKIPERDWTNTGDPETWADRSREHRGD